MKSWLIPLGVTYCLLLLPIKGHGQTNFQELPSVSVGIGYFGELFTHPGLVLYGDFALNQDQNQWLTRVNLVHYRHRGHSANTLLLPELLFRRHTTRQSY
ncbi:MAG TPA: hypothetical protein DCP28_10510, partial [Cytophagales bacterium]|nr:hypothetical protein [Cytophagales bacterium]